MSNKKIITVLLLCCAVAVWVYNISLVTDIASLSVKSGPRSRDGSGAEAAVLTGSSSLVDRALGVQPKAAARLRGGFTGESPFRMASEARAAAGSAPHRPLSPPSRPRLTLKGVLYKSSPLAILEDATGGTSIIGVGDTLLGQKVAGITKTSVTLRDRHGTYELSVKE
jgi:hypothetical protein